MLPKSKRLNLKKDFQPISKKGKRLFTQSLNLFFITDNLQITKVGIALKTANFKEAHDRNRARRLVSAAVESIYETLPKGLQLVIMPKSNVLSLSKEEIQEELKVVYSS
jgi:ribonuclease P protein component